MNIRKPIAAICLSSMLYLAFSSSVLADQKIQDDLVVVGSICAGFDCVNGESFGFDTLRLKENNLRIKFQDTSGTGSFPTNDWQITINDSTNGGANYFAIEDIGAGRTPFTILAAAPNDSLYVGSNGNIGLGTSTPVVDMQIKSGNTPTVRLEQDGSSGFASQSWDIGGNESNFFIRDATNGSKLPFRIVPNAPNASIYIAADGDIGFETTTPDGQFDVAHSSDANNHAFLISSSSDVGINIDNGLEPNGLFDVQSTGASLFTVASDGNVGFGTATTSSASGAAKVVEIKSVTSTSLTMDYGSQNNDFAELTFEKDNNAQWSAGVYADNYFYIYNYPDSKSYMTILPGSGNIGLGGEDNPTGAIEHSNGAKLTTSGVWENASSRSLKHDIKPLSTISAKSAFMLLKPVTYSYNATPTELTVGFVAEDVPDLVATASHKTLSTMDIVAVMAKVVQDQETTINELKKSVEKLILQQQNSVPSL
jgi:hypothetical protein